MKKFYLPLLITIIVLLASNLPAVEITYTVTSGGTSSQLTTDYDLNAGSRADSQIDITSHPSIASQTTVSTQGNDNDIEITTGANDGAGSTSNASVRIFDAVDTASINTNAAASNSTSASVHATGTGATAGIIKGESDGNKKFCAFTGDFDVSSDTGGGNVGISSHYTNPQANIFYVSKDPIPCHNPVYDDIPDVFDTTNGLPTPSNEEGRPDYVFVDHDGVGDDGKYTGAKIGGKNNLTLLGVWGADNTTIDGRDVDENGHSDGDTLYVHDSDNFTVEGFTVTGGETALAADDEDGKQGNGIGVYNGLNTKITDNTATGNDGAGIGVGGSLITRITGNTASGGNGWAGIGVYESIGTQIQCNTANDNGNPDIENDGAGIYVFDSTLTQVKDNTTTNNEGAGIIVEESWLTGVNGNTSNDNEKAGILVCDSTLTRIKDNTSTNNDGSGISVINSRFTGVNGNTANENGLAGINVSSSNITNLKNNSASGNTLHGISVINSRFTGVNGNTANDNGVAGIGVKSSQFVNIEGNTVSLNQVGVRIAGATTANVAVNQNNIFSNSGGLQNITGKNVNAQYNWWGDASGPFNPATNPTGTGNAVSNNVTFKPWSPVKF